MDPSPRAKTKNGPKSRRFRRTRSAPLAENQIEGEKTNAILDAVYFCIVTMTTLGYGDLVPDSILAKLLACAFVFTGMALVGLILSQAADYLVEKQEILLIKVFHVHQKFGETDVLKEVETNSLSVLDIDKYYLFSSVFPLHCRAIYPA
ncbi:hypothetical protein ACLB2K_031535 [Fragaria x ananassa]